VTKQRASDDQEEIFSPGVLVKRPGAPPLCYMASFPSIPFNTTEQARTLNRGDQPSSRLVATCLKWFEERTGSLRHHTRPGGRRAQGHQEIAPRRADGG